MLIERGASAVTVRDDVTGAEWTGAPLRELCRLLTEVETRAAEAIPRWARIPFDALLDRWDGTSLPGFWGRAGKQESFFNSREELDNWIELQRATLGADAVVYSGPDSGVNADDAPLSSGHFAQTDGLVKALLALEEQGMQLRGGGRWTARTAKGAFSAMATAISTARGSSLSDDTTSCTSPILWASSAGMRSPVSR